MAKTCLKCGYMRTDSDAAPQTECPQCGAIYAKVEQAAAQGKAIRRAGTSGFGEQNALPPSQAASYLRRKLPPVVLAVAVSSGAAGIWATHSWYSAKQAGEAAAVQERARVAAEGQARANAIAKRAADAERLAMERAAESSRQQAGELARQLAGQQLAAQQLATIRRLAAALERQEAASGGISLGMSKEAVIRSPWGRPDTINTSTYTFGVHEQWVYRNRGYLYFKDGVLTSFQQSSR